MRVIWYSDDIDSRRPNTNVSVDRINPNLGYTKDNIQFICMAVNQNEIWFKTRRIIYVLWSFITI